MTLEFKIETAMCIWEEMLNLSGRSQGNWKSAFENLGTGEMRLEASKLIDPLMADWKTVEDSFTRCFDWDFVPQWIHDNVTIDDDLEITLRADRIIPTSTSPAVSSVITENAPNTIQADHASPATRTVRLAVEALADRRILPETIRANVAAALELMTATGDLNDADIDDGRIAGVTVTIDETPQDEDGPFAIFTGAQGDIAEESARAFDTWIAALASARASEDAGLFVEIQNASAETVYATEA